jgi:hypothetical protein
METQDRWGRRGRGVRDAVCRHSERGWQTRRSALPAQRQIPFEKRKKREGSRTCEAWQDVAAAYNPLPEGFSSGLIVRQQVGVAPSKSAGR